MKKKLDPFNLFLYGNKIIEASAGTGKTLTLIIIYLRLLLGINCSLKKNVFSVQEILVVTFTQFTRAELLRRIKINIYNLRIACIKKKSNNPILQKILYKIVNFNEAIILLLQAENNFNQASIYTIHGFCHNILNENKLYSNILTQNMIIENIESLYSKATHDFWNKTFDSFPNEIGKIIYSYWKGPEHFLDDIFNLIKLSYNIITVNFKKQINILQHHQSLIKIINNFKKKWLNIQDKILILIKNSNVNKRVYHEKNLLKWIGDITLWAKNPTKNYFIPHVLNYFKHTILNKKINKQNTINYSFFKEIDNFTNIKFSLKEVFLSHAIKEIPIIIKKEKKNTSQIEFNDLLILFYRALQKHTKFTKFLQNKYPIALIDEFQDTDLYQYKIFKTIYKNVNHNLLILIGDPKQSIYSFRGANIFSYLKAKSEIKEQYYLDTNWRSSYNMTTSINYIFSRLKKPFLLSEIDFIPVKSPIKNKKMFFKINKKNQPALRFLINKEEKIKMDEYHTWISKECANHIAYWLKKGKEGKAVIKKGKNEYPVKPCDIVIIVKNKIEANIIKKELDYLNITSCYLSKKENIYHTKEAYELLLILHAILEPRNETLLKKAMFTRIFSYDYKEINNLNENISIWSDIIETFKKYSVIWKQSGILTMINKIIEHNICSQDQYDVDHILYLSELLQQKYRYINNMYLLILWFENKIYTIKKESKKNYFKTSVSTKCIKIITIYKSKGLQYNIVWIPFAINFSKTKFHLYHNRKNNKMVFDGNINETNLNTSKIEILSEEIRLLYVSLTRAVLHCSMGIAPICQNSKKYDFTDLHQSSLGYIIQLGKICNTLELEKELKKISEHNDIELQYKNINYDICNKKIKKEQKIITEKTVLNRSINDYWTITSYSKLKNMQQTKNKNNVKINIYSKLDKKIINYTSYTSHTFPKGVIYGIFLHEILKEHIFHKKVDRIWLNKKLKKYNINKIWLNMLEKWIDNIMHTPLLNQSLTLYTLKEKNIKELEFYIPIEKKLIDCKINKIIKYYDNISQLCPDLSFNTIQGMLTGSIDLIFLWKKKYYIVDYKSNWLGDSSNLYTENNIKNQIIKNRYDLQYQLYTLVLHRYLKQRIKKYEFSSHFGGIFYLFLRAFDGSHIKYGVFYTQPKYELIKKLDMIFSI